MGLNYELYGIFNYPMFKAGFSHGIYMGLNEIHSADELSWDGPMGLLTMNRSWDLIGLIWELDSKLYGNYMFFFNIETYDCSTKTWKGCTGDV